MDSESNLLVQLLILLVLIAINAFFAASEIAIISLNSQKIRKQAEDGEPEAILLQKLVAEPSKFLATIQVGVTLAGLMASAVAAESFADHLTGYLKTLRLPLDTALISLISIMGITLVLSYFTLVLGELVPKRLAMQMPERISGLVAKPLALIQKFTGPFVRLLSFSTNLLIKLLGGNPAYTEEKITEEEIRLMVDVGQEKGVIRSTEKEMINNIFQFDNTAVSAVMTHRIDVVGLPRTATLDEVLDTVIAEKFSRIPIYDGTIDKVVGILHVQDLIPRLKDPDRSRFDLMAAVREPYFVPASKKTDELLKELQKQKTHLAVVIDEYGGTAGIVTVEDLLEEIVGNIFDEHDEVRQEIVKLDESTYLLDGSISLAKIEELLDVKLPCCDYDTLSGFVIGELGRFPKEGEHPVIEYEGLVLKVEAVEEKRISRVKIGKL